MKQEKCIIRLGNEWLVCFWGEIDGEICGLLTYPIPAPLLLKYPQ